jgi:hypothetical protein
MVEPARWKTDRFKRSGKSQVHQRMRRERRHVVRVDHRDNLRVRMVDFKPGKQLPVPRHRAGFFRCEQKPLRVEGRTARRNLATHFVRLAGPVAGKSFAFWYMNHLTPQGNTRPKYHSRGPLATAAITFGILQTLRTCLGKKQDHTGGNDAGGPTGLFTPESSRSG